MPGTVVVVTAVAIVIAVALPGYAPLAYVLAVGSAAFETFDRARTEELSNLRYFAAPLYGRELARAHALVASARFVALALFIGAFVTLAGLFVPHLMPAGGAYRLVVMTLGQVVTSLVAMSGALRRGRERWLYIGLALATGLTIDGIGSPATPVALLCAVVIAAALGFAALRAFGESLARYDPIE